MKKPVAVLLLFSVLQLLLPVLAIAGQPSPSGGSPFYQPLSERPCYLLLRTKTGEVEQLTPAEYVAGVVAAEMPISYETEALKAQAVAAHTYALRQIGAALANPDETLQSAYFSDDPSRFQAYLSPEERQACWGDRFAENEARLQAAVHLAINEVMTYGGVPIVAAFHAISPGVTEACETVWSEPLPYLRPVESEGDLLSPNYQAEASRTADEVRAAFTDFCPGLTLSDTPEDWLRVTERSEAGTVLTLLVGDKQVTGQDARALLRLRSADFTPAYADGQFIFTTRGHGHGVGLSQYGADYMARQGADYREILSHYYTGVSFERLT